MSDASASPSIRVPFARHIRGASLALNLSRFSQFACHEGHLESPTTRFSSSSRVRDSIKQRVLRSDAGARISLFPERFRDSSGSQAVYFQDFFATGAPGNDAYKALCDAKPVRKKID
jgi:hypothetical protein